MTADEHGESKIEPGPASNPATATAPNDQHDPPESLDDVRLQPAADLPPSDLLRRAEYWLNLALLRAPRRERFQFHIADLMLMTVAVSIGIAGGLWVPGVLFAAVLGVLTLVGMALDMVFEISDRRFNVFWLACIVAYLVASLAATFRVP